VEFRLSSYSLEDLKRKLNDKGWQAITVKPGRPMEGTLLDMLEAAYWRHKNGYPIGIVREVSTRIKLGLPQLEELWLHLGLPNI
jgi:hypothetical protein